MSNLVYISDHTDAAYARLAAEFKGDDKPLIQGLLYSFVLQHQGMEDALKQMLEDRTIDTAVGMQLDGIGFIVGEDRQGRTDDVYRIALKARIGRNTSEGTPEDILNVFNLLSGSTKTMLIELTAVITLTANVDFSANAAAIKGFTQKVLAAGVRLDWIAAQIPANPGDPPFAFFGVADAAGFDEGTFVKAF